jgi:hypothetical protein
MRCWRMGLHGRLVTVATLVALAAPLHGTMPSQRPTQENTDNVLVTRVSADPTAVSGVLVFFVEFAGESRTGERTYLIPFMRIGQAKPRVGQNCSVDWHWWRSGSGITGDSRSVSDGRWVTDFRCRGGGG